MDYPDNKPTKQIQYLEILELLGQSGADGFADSDSNRPGQAVPTQAWPGPAYGGAEKAWPIGLS